MITALVERPSPESNARYRNTGSSASRTKPIALGIVHGRSGWPLRVSGGGPPERSSPSSRRRVREARATGPPALALRPREAPALGGRRALVEADLLHLREVNARGVAVLSPHRLGLE